MRRRCREIGSLGYLLAGEQIRGHDLLSASQWSPISTVVGGRTTQVDTVPTGHGRPRGDATTCPMDESMTSRPTLIEPGNADRGGGGRVITKPNKCQCPVSMVQVRFAC